MDTRESDRHANQNNSIPLARRLRGLLAGLLVLTMAGSMVAGRTFDAGRPDIIAYGKSKGVTVKVVQVE